MRKLLLLAVTVVSVCSTYVSGQEPTSQPNLFDRNHVLQIEIDLLPSDWREIRLSHRDASDVAMSRIAEDGAYEYRPADITIDGVRVARVGVRKKGLIGSVVSTRPSLKIKFDEFVDDQEFAGLDGLTLNNGNQDQAMVQAFLAYDLYARAGVEASRASFAHVTVNGEDLGIYTNVEPIQPPLLRRVFGSSNGVLYESYAGDFAPNWPERIIEKRGGRNQDRTQIEALTKVLGAPGPVSLADVEALVNLDRFMRMWAVESLMGHWDSYSGNRNNYYLYANPATKKLEFIPWGPDSVFADPGPLQAAVVPKSYKAMGLLSRRLWELPEIRERYRTIMRELLAGPWDESRLLADMASLQKLLQPQSTFLPKTVETASAVIADFIKNRRAEVEAELVEPAPEWPAAATPGRPVPMTITGSFTAPWSVDAPVNPLLPGSGELHITIGGTPVPAFERVAASSTTYKQGDAAPLAGIREKYHAVTITGQAGERVWQLLLAIDPLRLEPGRQELPVDHYAVWAILVAVDEQGQHMQLWGNVGTLLLEEASVREGGVVRGTFTLNGAWVPGPAAAAGVGASD